MVVEQRIVGVELLVCPIGNIWIFGCSRLQYRSILVYVSHFGKIFC
jgi:hypothetical protein